MGTPDPGLDPAAVSDPDDDAVFVADDAAPSAEYVETDAQVRP